MRFRGVTSARAGARSLSCLCWRLVAGRLPADGECRPRLVVRTERAQPRPHQASAVQSHSWSRRAQCAGRSTLELFADTGLRLDRHRQTERRSCAAAGAATSIPRPAPTSTISPTSVLLAPLGAGRIDVPGRHYRARRAGLRVRPASRRRSREPSFLRPARRSKRAPEDSHPEQPRLFGSQHRPREERRETSTIRPIETPRAIHLGLGVAARARTRLRRERRRSSGSASSTRSSTESTTTAGTAPVDR